MDREHPFFRLAEKAEVLLENESDPENSADDEQGDDRAAAPGVDGAAEVDGHYDGQETADAENGTNPVDPLGSFFDGKAWSRIAGWDQEDVGWENNGTEQEVDVESPSPRVKLEGTWSSRLVECRSEWWSMTGSLAANDWTKNGAQAPNHASEQRETMSVPSS